MRRVVLKGLRRSTFLAALAALAHAPAALADTARSTNWAGYAAHGSGVSFRSVRGSWVEPGVSCVRGKRTFSSYWVGIGGYSESSQALEQVGTEVDCTAAGNVRSTAWYELVPAPSVPVRLTIRPGDLMQASVSIGGRSVTVWLYDATRRRGFRRTIRTSALDLTSAEWIVEAPSECISASSCQTLPLANFGSAVFASASAQSAGRRSGGIASPLWQATKINLRPDSRRFVVNSNSGPELGIATPSALPSGGTSFKVSYSLVPFAGLPSLSAGEARLRDGHIVHPRR